VSPSAVAMSLIQSVTLRRITIDGDVVGSTRFSFRGEGADEGLQLLRGRLDFDDGFLDPG
jgi:hypothetical protein